MASPPCAVVSLPCWLLHPCYVQTLPSIGKSPFSAPLPEKPGDLKML